jgi:hypothetical protein
MKSGGGKAKGAAFERKVCQELSLWISGGKHKDLYWRSAMSGGRATVARKRGTALARQAGDITATAPEGHKLTDFFYIECKHVRSLKIDRFIIEGTGPLAQFWHTTCKEAKAHNRQPMLIAKQNGLSIIVVTKSNDLYTFSKKITDSMHTVADVATSPASRICLYSDMLTKRMPR